MIEDAANLRARGEVEGIPRLVIMAGAGDSAASAAVRDRASGRDGVRLTAPVPPTKVGGEDRATGTGAGTGAAVMAVVAVVVAAGSRGISISISTAAGGGGVGGGRGDGIVVSVDVDG